MENGAYIGVNPHDTGEAQRSWQTFYQVIKIKSKWRMQHGKINQRITDGEKFTGGFCW